MAVAVITMATAFSFTSCHNGNEPAPTQQTKDKTIQFYVAGIETRTINGNINSSTLPQDHTVGVFGVPTQGSAIASNKKYTVGSDRNLTPDGSTEMVAKANTTLNIYAYAPHNAAWISHSTAQSFAVKADQTYDDNYLASDLLHAAPEAITVSEAQPSVGLTFNHKMARIQVTVTNNKANEDLEGATIKLNNTILSGTFTPLSGAVAVATADAEDITMATFDEIKNEVIAYAVIFPQTIAAQTTLFTIETEDKTFTATLGSETTFEGGKSYAYTVNINENDVNITLQSKATVTNWDSNTTGGNFDATENKKESQQQPEP